MNERKIQVFLYGSAIGLDVLADIGLKKRAFAPASLTGFDLIIQPVANIVENGDGIVYGILANFTHPEVELLTNQYKQSISSATFNPEPVIVHTRGGKLVPAFTYLSVDMKPDFASSDYIDSILKPAKNYGFPRWYLERIAAFRSEQK